MFVSRFLMADWRGENGSLSDSVGKAGSAVRSFLYFRFAIVEKIRLFKKTYPCNVHETGKIESVSIVDKLRDCFIAVAWGGPSHTVLFFFTGLTALMIMTIYDVTEAVASLSGAQGDLPKVSTIDTLSQWSSH